MRLLFIFGLVLISQSGRAVDFVCHSDSNLTLNISGLETLPAAVSSIVLFDNSAPKDTLITKVDQGFAAVSVEFVNMETVSAFSFEVSTQDVVAPSFTMNVFELGPPGSNSSNHVFGCVKQ